MPRLRCARPSVRVYFSLRPDEFGLEGLYLYLASLDSIRAKVHAIRQILVLRKRITPTAIPPITEKFSAINFRMIISERDIGLEDLHDDLLKQINDSNRRVILKNAVARIYLGNQQPHQENTGLPLTPLKFEQIPQKANDSSVIVERSSIASAESADKNTEPSTTKANNSPEISVVEPSKIMLNREDIETQDPPIASGIEKKNSDFRRLMRDASRSFEF